MIFKYLWKSKWLILGFLSLAVLEEVLRADLALKIAELFDLAEVQNYTKLLLLFPLLITIYIFTRLSEYYAELTGLYVVNKTRKSIKNDLFSAILQKQLSTFANRNSGEYIAEFTNDITIIETKYLLPLKNLVTYLIAISVAGVTIFTIDLYMAAVLLIGVFICLLFPILTSRYTSNKMLNFLENFDRYVQYLKDDFGAFFTFKNYAVEKDIVKQFSEENEQIEKKKYDAEIALVVMNNIIGRLAWLIPLFVLIVGLIGVLNQRVKIGDVIAAYLLANSIGRPLQSIGGTISEIRSVRGIEKKFQSFYKIQGEASSTNMESLEQMPFDIVLNDVSLIRKNKTIVHGLSFCFEQGKKYLIIGSNGSGKSTTAKLLKQTFTDYTGDIFIGPYNLRESAGIALSKRISYSNETVSLLSDTVKNNILLYRDISDQQLAKITHKVELYVQMDRVVGDNGRFLSSGERRKLEIARALISKPQVLILDEVVSTLDIETAYEIEKLVLGLSETVIMVSNVFSGKLIDKYDQIILMDNGRIVASGHHYELLENSQLYREIFTIRCGTDNSEE